MRARWTVLLSQGTIIPIAALRSRTEKTIQAGFVDSRAALAPLDRDALPACLAAPLAAMG